MSLHERIQEVEARVAKACARAGRKREDVQIVAVTKYVSLPSTVQAVQAGLDHIGENRWQDAREKWESIGTDRVTWHFIGHLQTNKVKDVIGKFAYIHSLDRLSLAEELNKRAAALNRTVNVLVQLNISGEQSKYGLPPEQAEPFLRQIRSYDRLNIAGLMTMAPFEAEPEATRPVFRGLREMRDRLNESGVLPYPLRHLSMGMSNDFEVAVEEGATYIRLGSVLVGKD